MSENRRKIRGFGAVDFIIVLGLAAVLCGLFLRVPLSEKINGHLANEKVSILFETEGLLHTEISIGETIYCDGVEIGVVSNVSYLPKYEYRLDESNTPYYTEAEGLEIVTFRVEGKGTSDGYGTYINGKTFVAPGMTMQTYTLGDKTIDSRIKYVETTDKIG